MSNRAYHLRLGFIRLHRYYFMDFRRLWIVRMHEGPRPILGWEFQWRNFGLQVAWYWWGFGKDGGA
jgi:hypothetical protein